MTFNNLQSKIAIVGFWEWHHYEQSFGDALSSLNVDVVKFDLKPYFNLPFLRRLLESGIYPRYCSRELENDILKFCLTNNVTQCFFWRPICISKRILTELRKHQVASVSYNNDSCYQVLENSFIGFLKKSKWHLYLDALSEYDLNLFYRPYDLQLSHHVSRLSRLMLPYYIPSIHKPYVTDYSQKDCHVIFAGHFENDERIKVIELLLDNNIPLKIYGDTHSWSKAPNTILSRLPRIVPLRGSDYARALSKARLALVFLSSKNHDTYTRRCFEIPACGTVMLAPRTVDMLNIYPENSACLYYSDPIEALIKCKHYLESPVKLAHIASNAITILQKRGFDPLSTASSHLEFCRKHSLV